MERTVTNHGGIEAARHGIARSSQWPKVERAFVLRYPQCAACVKNMSGVQVHHVFPFHYCIALGYPQLELDPRNLITLCETEHGISSDDHHLLLGHLDDFKSSNLSVRSDVIKYHGMNHHTIINNPDWLAAKANKVKPLDEMTDQDKQDFIALMKSTYGL